MTLENFSAKIEWGWRHSLEMLSFREMLGIVLPWKKVTAGGLDGLVWRELEDCQPLGLTV